MKLLVLFTFLLVVSCKGDAKKEAPLKPSATATAAPAAGPCDTPKYREQYKSAKEMQLTSDPFEAWCETRLAQEQSKKQLDQRISQASKVSPKELCSWSIDRMGGPRFYLAVRADKFDGRHDALPEPLRAYLAVEKFERYAGSAGLQGYIEKMDVEGGADMHVAALQKQLKVVAVKSLQPIAAKLLKREKMDRDAWSALDKEFYAAQGLDELAAFFVANCEKMAMQIDEN
tara:strand:+ start:7919 stop:8608 length:690 start_codon:yes stop_codon:yes gene_type:complete